MTAKVTQLLEMTWEEVDELDPDQTLIFVPISPIEEHGPHLPLGTDIFGARDIARRAAAMVSDESPHLRGILAPPIPLGCSDITADFPGTLSLRGTTLCSVVEDFCAALAGSGFKYMVIANHHLDPVHLKAILKAIETVTLTHDVKIIENIARIAYSGMKTEEARQMKSMGLDVRTEIHADVKETSFIMHGYPHLIKKDPGGLAPVPINVKEGLKQGHRTFRQMGAEQGYIGTPAMASKEHGRLHIEEIARLTADMAIKLIQDKPLPEIHPSMLKFLEVFIQL